MFILLIFIGIFAGYIFYSQTLKGQPPEIAPIIVRQDDLIKLKDTKLDFSVFDNSLYKSLRIFGEAPVNPGVTGRINIFAPF